MIPVVVGGLQAATNLFHTSSLPARLAQNQNWYNAVVRNDQPQAAANSLYNVGYGTAERQPAWQVGGVYTLADQGADAKAKYQALVASGLVDANGAVVPHSGMPASAGVTTASPGPPAASGQTLLGKVQSFFAGAVSQSTTSAGAAAGQAAAKEAKSTVLLVGAILAGAVVLAAVVLRRR